MMVICSSGDDVESVKENGWGHTIKISLAS